MTCSFVEARAGWDVRTPSPGIDPFLAATLWALDRSHPAMIVGPDARKALSVHARTLLEGAIHLDGSHPGPLMTEPGLGVVLAMPTPAQLEGLRTSRFHPGTAWFLLPSEAGSTERDFQDAWAWAHQRPAPRAGPPPPDLLALSGLLTDLEAWALLVRADDPARAAALRAPRRLRLLPKASM